MFKRRRLTMKEASPPPSTPAVGNVLPADHPATKDDPGKDDYKTGDPSSWAEDPNPPPYADTPPPSTPGYEGAGAEHPAHKKAAEEAAALEALRKKAAKAIKLVEGMADKSASQDDMQNAAMALLNLPEGQIDATLATLSKLGFFTAQDMEMDEGMGDDMGTYASKMRAMEEEIQAMKAQLGLTAQDPMMDESPGDDIVDPNSFTGVEGMGDDVDSMYQAMVQEEAMRLAGGKAGQEEEEEEEMEMDEEASKKAGALALKIHQLRKAMEEDDDDSDEGKEAKKAAAAAIADAEKALTILTAKKSELPPEFLENQKGKGDDDKDEDGDKEAKKASDDEDGDKEGQEDEEAAKKAAAEAEAAAVLAAAEQGTTPDEAIVMANNAGLDPMGLAGLPDIGNDDVLSLLFKTGMEDEDASDEDKEAKKGEDEEAAKKAAAVKAAQAEALAKLARTASGPKPQPKTPGVGPDTLGSLIHTAGAGGGSGVDALSSIWETKPDVSDHFA